MLKPGLIVRHRETKIVGVTVSTPMPDPGDNLFSVIFDGTSVADGCIDEADLEVIGRYAAIADFEGCGHGKEACRFATVTADGIQCARFSDMHWGLVFKGGMVAQRFPDRLYPDCQLKRK